MLPAEVCGHQSEETGHEINGGQAEGCGMWKPCRNEFEYHHRKGFGGFAKVVVVHSHRGGYAISYYPISYCGLTVQMKVFHLK